MWTALLLVASIYACHATDYVSSTFSSTYVKTSKAKVKMDLEMDVTSNVVTLTLLGPSDKWYSVGFESTTMADTYSVIVDGYGDVSERYLVGKTEGDELDFTWNIESNTVDSSYRTVVLTRDYDYELASTNYHQFATSYSKLKTIYGYGTGADLDNHGEDKRGSAELKASRTAMTKQEAESRMLWGEVSEEMMEEEYDGYLTTSSVLTWITCIVALCIMGFFAYKKFVLEKYEAIPDDCTSNVSMVRMGASVPQEEIQV